VAASFSNLVILHLPAYEDGTDRVFRNVGISNSDAGELPRRKHTKTVSTAFDVVYKHQSLWNNII